MSSSTIFRAYTFWEILWDSERFIAANPPHPPQMFPPLSHHPPSPPHYLYAPPPLHMPLYQVLQPWGKSSHPLCVGRAGHGYHTLYTHCTPPPSSFLNPRPPKWEIDELFPNSMSWRAVGPLGKVWDRYPAQPTPQPAQLKDLALTRTCAQLRVALAGRCRGTTPLFSPNSHTYISLIYYVITSRQNCNYFIIIFHMISSAQLRHPKP